MSRRVLLWLALAMASAAQSQEAMTYKQMATVMQMDDTASFGKVMLDQLEWRDGDSRAAWDAQAWYGGDANKIWLKTEGTYEDHSQRNVQASIEALWDRVVARWWNVQAGVRQDFGPGAARTWLAAGVEGIAPYWLQTDATVYASDGGHTAARLKAQYDLLLSQRLILQPYVEANLYGRSDAPRQTGSGLSDLQLSVRLRYEIRREFAPYAGVVWLRRFGGTADFARAAGGTAADLELAAGVHLWF